MIKPKILELKAVLINRFSDSVKKINETLKAKRTEPETAGSRKTIVRTYIPRTMIRISLNVSTVKKPPNILPLLIKLSGK